MNMQTFKYVYVAICFFCLPADAWASELPGPKQTLQPAGKAKSSGRRAYAPKSSGAIGGVPGGKNLLINGSFEYSPAFEGGWKNYEAPSSNLYAWQVSKGNVDLFQNCHAPENRRAIDLEGQEAGTIRQAFKTEPGANYELKFCAGCHPLGGGPVKKIFAKAADQAATWAFDCGGYGGDNLGWREIVWRFTAHEPTTILECGSLEPHGTGGALVTNFSVMKLGGKVAGKPSQSKQNAAAQNPAGKPPSANLVFNGSFEQGADPGDGWTHYSAGSTEIPGWRVATGDIDLWGGIKTPFGKKTIDLDGQQAGSVLQAIRTEPGCTYRLKFFVGSYDSQSKNVFARVAGKKQLWPISVSGSTQNPSLREVSFEFKARDNTTSIEIGSATPGTQGPVIDNVSCEKIADAEPKPAAVDKPSQITSETDATKPAPATEPTQAPQPSPESPSKSAETQTAKPPIESSQPAP